MSLNRKSFNLNLSNGEHTQPTRTENSSAFVHVVGVGRSSFGKSNVKTAALI